VVLLLESQVVEMSEDLLLVEVFVLSVIAVAGLHSAHKNLNCVADSDLLLLGVVI
jgi:hypothetical protein